VKWSIKFLTTKRLFSKTWLLWCHWLTGAAKFEAHVLYWHSCWCVGAVYMFQIYLTSPKPMEGRRHEFWQETTHYPEICAYTQASKIFWRCLWMFYRRIGEQVQLKSHIDLHPPRIDLVRPCSCHWNIEVRLLFLPKGEIKRTWKEATETIIDPHHTIVWGGQEKRRKPVPFSTNTDRCFCSRAWQGQGYINP